MIIETGPFAGIELIESMMGPPVIVDRASLAALDALLARFPKDAGAEFVADKHGMQGVLVRWEDGEEYAELWWFEDESHESLYRWEGEVEA